MALKAKSKFIYGFEITEQNSSLDFKKSASGGELQATLRLGFYSLGGLLKEVERAMKEVDLDNNYFVSAIRNVGSSGDVRVVITTSGSYLDLLFGSGSRKATTCAFVLGFLGIDYIGGTSYQAANNAGKHLVTEMIGYNYVDALMNKKVFGSVNVSASGVKEAVVYNIQKFVSVNFRFEPRTKIFSQWTNFLDWAILQRPFEFVPEITSPNKYYDVTLETTTEDTKGLGFEIREMLPNFPDLFEIGNMKMRVNEL